MQPHEKSVKLFVDCLSCIQALPKPLQVNKHERSTPEDVNFRHFTLTCIETGRFRIQRIKS